MKIAAKLKLAALVPVLMALVISVALIFSYKVVYEAHEKDRAVQRVIAAMNRLGGYVSEYLLYHEQRPVEQYLAEHASILQIVDAFRFDDQEQQQILDHVRRDIGAMKGSFLRLVSNYERHGSAVDNGLVEEVENRLAGRLLVWSRDVTSKAYYLGGLIDRELTASQRRINLLIFGLLVAATLFLTIVLMGMMKNITASLKTLRRGTEAIGSGNLDYRICMQARDEIGELSRSFDRMTEQLQTVTVSKNTLQQEVEERKKAEGALRENREWLRVTLSSIGDAVMTTDTRGRVTFLNPVASALTGWPAEEAQGRPVQDVLRTVNELTREPARDVVQCVLTDDCVVQMANNTALIRRDGSEIPIEDTAAPIKDDAGHFLGVVIVFHDVTEKRRAHETLRQSAEKLRIVSDFNYDWEYWRSPDNRFLYVSPSCERVTGYSREEFLKEPDLYSRIIHPDDRERVLKHFRQDQLSRESYELEFRIVHRDGRERWIAHVCRPVLDEKGQMLGRRASNRDITERKRAEEELRQARDRALWLARFPDENPNPVVRVSAEGTVLYCNPSAVNLHQWACSVGRPLDGRLRPLVNQAMAEGQHVQGDVQIGGRFFWVGVAPFPAEGYVNIYGRDVTDRKQVEEERERLLAEVQAEQEKLSALVNSIQDEVWFADTEKRFIIANPAALREFALGTGEFVDVEKFAAGLEVFRPDGSPRPVEESPPLRALKGEIVTNQVEIIRTPASGELRYRQVSAAPVKDLDGNILGSVSVVRDITDRKRAEEELRRSRDELELRVQERTDELKVRAEQLARLSSQLTLAEQRERRRLGVVIHDHLQQLLVAAKIRLEVLNRKLEKLHQPDLGQILNLLVESLKTARSLNTQLSPAGLYERGLAVGLEWLARSMQETYQIKIETDIDPAISPERDDIKVLLYESARELLFNMVKHSRVKSGRLSLTREDSDKIRISVSDQGVGFDPHKLRDELGLDERFGLFSIRERLELLGGSMEIESSPGKGSTFTLIAPLKAPADLGPKDAAAVDLVIAESAPKPSPGREAGEKIRVMLADDHVVVRQGLLSMLEGQADIKVVGEAANGEEALRLARELQPDVILMDISMPKMGGLEATRLIHAELPGIRIIGLSMYDDAETKKGILNAGAAAFLTKSSPSNALLAAIRGSPGSV